MPIRPLIVCLLWLSAYHTHAADWQALASLNTARHSFAAGIVAGKLYVVGGIDQSGHLLDSPEMLDLANPSAWQHLPSIGTAIAEPSGATTAEHFFVFGGSDSNGQNIDLNMAYQPVVDTWHTLVQPLTLRASAAAVAIDDEVLLFGGHDWKNSKKRLLKTVERYDTVKQLWRNETAMPVALESAAAAEVNGQLYVFGGLQAGNKASNAVLRYDPISRKWQRSGLTPLPAARLFAPGHAAPILNGKVYLLGGASLIQSVVAATDTVWIYDPQSNTWQTAPKLPQRLMRHTALATDSEIIAVGGTGGNNSMTVKQVWQLTDSWKASLTAEQSCDLTADGKFSNQDATLFDQACRQKTAYWPCDLNGDSRFDAKDLTAYKNRWQTAKSACPTVEPGRLTLSATSLNFGSIEIGSASATQTITLTNSGKRAIAIETIASSVPQLFTISHDCDRQLAVAASCRVSVVFTPAQAGAMSGRLSIAAQDLPDATIPLSGTGLSNEPTVTLSATVLSFDNIDTGKTSTSQSLQLTNTGKAALTIQSITVDSPLFTLTSNCGTSLAIGAHCTLNCRFTPVAIGSFNATVAVVSDASGSPHRVILQGSGVSPGDAIIADAFAKKLSDLQVEGIGTVTRILSDDLVGDRHQRFILRLGNGITVLVAHNIDIAPRIDNLQLNDSVAFFGEYVWSSQGGTVHWTHHDPSGPHIAGWLRHDGKIYQ